MQYRIPTVEEFRGSLENPPAQFADQLTPPRREQLVRDFLDEWDTRREQASQMLEAGGEIDDEARQVLLEAKQYEHPQLPHKAVLPGKAPASPRATPSRAVDWLATSSALRARIASIKASGPMGSGGAPASAATLAVGSAGGGNAPVSPTLPSRASLDASPCFATIWVTPSWIPLSKACCPGGTNGAPISAISPAMGSAGAGRGTSGPAVGSTCIARFIAP